MSLTAPSRFCLGCRYPLDGLERSTCPECGRAFDLDDPSTYLWKPAKCPECGYQLTGNLTGQCPECGYHFAPPAPPDPIVAPDPADGKAPRRGNDMRSALRRLRRDGNA